MQLFIGFGGGSSNSERETEVISEERDRVHNTNPNSIKAFREFNRDRKQNTGTAITISALREAGQPLTRRQISKITKIEIGTLCRILLDAIRTDDPLVKIVRSGACPISGKTASFYQLTDEVLPL